MKLASYVGGRWQEGKGEGAALSDPATGEVVARATAQGVDRAGALRHARETGGPALRELSYAERAKLLRGIAELLSAHREQYVEIAQTNGGNTLADAAIDIDGGIATLKYYARLGAALGDARTMREGGLLQMGKQAEYSALHLRLPKQGVGIHINAFNFPSWGTWAKAAVALLAGVPVVTKPATATAWLAHAMIRDVMEGDLMPRGALSLLCGEAGDLLDHVEGEDVVAFTGSAETALAVRGHRAILRSNAAVNIEASSLNSAVLAPAAEADGPEERAFVKEVVREMTVKAGQKCTAIRRIFVPAGAARRVIEALCAELQTVVVGDPREDGVTMGPLATAEQYEAVRTGARRLSEEARAVCGNADAIESGTPGTAYFHPLLLAVETAGEARRIHREEVFGPVATVIPYRDEAELFASIRQGGGSLALSVFGPDSEFVARLIAAVGSAHGRILWVREDIAGIHSGHGIVMPMCMHGGPGLAGGGEELGGLGALRLYHQKLAWQGPAAVLSETAEAQPDLYG